jgi:hypothetical protein
MPKRQHVMAQHLPAWLVIAATEGILVARDYERNRSERRDGRDRSASSPSARGQTAAFERCGQQRRLAAQHGKPFRPPRPPPDHTSKATPDSLIGAPEDREAPSLISRTALVSGGSRVAWRLVLPLGQIRVAILGRIAMPVLHLPLMLQLLLL